MVNHIHMVNQTNMKNVLIIYGGPSQTGFNWETYQELERFTSANRYSVRSIDLYREDFDPVFREKEPEINKRMVANYQEMISAASVVIFISPIWWSRTTTMLEGFFDKTMTDGFAFKSNPKWTPLLSNKKAIMILTLGNKSKWRVFLYKAITYLRLKFGPLNDCFGLKTKVCLFSISKQTTKNDKAIILEKIKGIIRGNI